MPLALRALLVVTLVVAACKKTEPAAGTAAPPAAPAASAFTMRDLAVATALDARLARLSLAASDAEAALAAGAKARLAELEAARGEAERALATIRNAADRGPAERALTAARAHADALAARAASASAGAQEELLRTRDALGSAIAAYRQARARVRLQAPEPQGAERDFDGARRDMERVETALGSRTPVAPRDEGHERDPAARVTGELAARRAAEAAERLEPTLREPAARYAAAERRVLQAVTQLGGAAVGEQARLAREYHAAKADALAALADYFAALAAR
jgi:exonuclease SbcC